MERFTLMASMLKCLLKAISSVSYYFKESRLSDARVQGFERLIAQVDQRQIYALFKKAFRQSKQKMPCLAQCGLLGWNVNYLAL